jgi:hypothetical protein
MRPSSAHVVDAQALNAHVFDAHVFDAHVFDAQVLDGLHMRFPLAPGCIATPLVGLQ